LREQHAAAVKARGRIAAALEPIEIIVSNMRRLVDEAASRWAGEEARAMAWAFTSGLVTRSDERLFVKRPGLWDGPSGHLAFHDVVGLVPELVKARLETILRSSAFETGLPLEAREPAIADADRTIAAVEDLHTRLVDDAAGLGITLPLLPAVQARRAAEEARQAREATAIAARAAAEEELKRLGFSDAEPAGDRKTRRIILDADGARPTAKAAPSQYLRTGEIDGGDRVR
jgi:hypothetical protein